MLNAGHRKGATAGRCVVRGKIVETEELPAYCAVALAGLDDLPDTIMTRSVIVRMRRRSPDEPIEPWRPRVNGADARSLRNRLSAWSDQVLHLQHAEWPDMPPGVEDRDADVWEALLAVADLAGGHWPTTARKAAVTLVTESRKRTPSVGVLLLADIKTAFDRLDVEKAPTEDILAELGKMDEAPWSTIRRGESLDARGLANRLGKYGIGSKAQRDGERVFKGYSRSQFDDAWKRYPVQRIESVTSVTADTGATDVTAVTESNRRTRPAENNDDADGELGDSEASYAANPYSPDFEFLTSEDEEASQASHESTPSRDLSRPPLCPGCSLGPARSDTGMCDFCTAKARQQAITEQLDRLGGTS
jgi:hypothetical protein